MKLDIIARKINTCSLCRLYRYRKKAVPGEGSDVAKIMFVGEAPGAQEDIHGRPFVGRCGRLLDDVLAQSGFSRNDLFVTSVVKCRPPKNRIPYKEEWEICLQAYLLQQIKEINPEIICLLGGLATKALLGINRLYAVRGQPVKRDRVFFPTYHPAAALRNPAWYRKLLEDMKRLGMLAKTKKYKYS